MPDVNETVVSELPRYVADVFDAMEAFIKMLKEFTERRRDAKTAKSLLEALEKGESCTTFLCRDFSAEDFKQEMEIMNCPCITMRANGGPGAGMLMVMFKEEDLAFATLARERALSRVSERMDEYGNIMRPATEVSMNTIDSLTKRSPYEEPEQIRGLNEAEVKFLAAELRTMNVPFARKEHPDGKTDLFFCSGNKDVVKCAFARAKIEFMGISGNYALQKAKMEAEAMRTALDRIEKQGEPFVVVSATNPKNTVLVTDSSVSHVLQNGKDSYSYRKVDKVDFVSLRNVYKQEVAALSHPVVLPKADYDACKNDPEKLEDLVSKNSSFPVYRDDMDKAHAETERLFKRALNQKLYGPVRAGIFDPETEKKEFEKVLSGELTLPEFLDIERGGMPPEGMEASGKRMEELKTHFECLPDGEKDAVTRMVGKCIESYISAEDRMEEKEFTTEELREELESQIEQINHEKTMGAFTVMKEREEDLGDED